MSDTPDPIIATDDGKGDIRIMPVSQYVAKLQRELADMTAQRDRLVGALEFIRDECDWEAHYGDDRIGVCCDAALAAVKGGQP